MTSNLLIATPDIPRRGTIATSVAAVTTLPATNLIAGPRTEHFQFGTAATDSWVRSSLSAASPCEYFIVARADLLFKQGVTGLLLKRSTDNSTYANHLGNVSDFQSASFFGENGEDYISTPSVNNSAVNYSASSFQYWRLHTSRGTALAYTYSKWYCGAFFDPGRDPIAPYTTEGQIQRGKGRRPARIVSFSWQGLTDVKAEYFNSLARESDSSPLFLYTASYHDLLHGQRLMHVRIVNISRRMRVPNVNGIDVTFEEVI